MPEAKEEIEYKNLWYFIECHHCFTLFMVEDSIDMRSVRTKAKKTFTVFCPRCGTQNKKAAVKRLKLKVAGIAKENEHDPYSTFLAKSLIIPGLDDKKESSH
jgi:RNase P subunit RPR2